MSDQRELKIVVGGDATGAQKALADTRSQINDTQKKLADLNAEAAKTTDPLTLKAIQVETKRAEKGLVDLTIKSRELEKEIASGAGAVAEVGPQVAGGMSMATAAVGALVGAVTLAIAAIGALAAGAFKAVNMAADWGNAIDGIQDVTGFTAEFASTLAHVGEIAGVSTDQIAQMMSANARIFREATEQAAKIRRQEAADRAEALRKNEDAQRKHAETITKLQADTVEKITELAEKQQRVDDDYRRDNEERSRKLNESLIDITESRNEAITESQKRTADKVNQLQTDIAEQQAKFAEQQAEIQNKVNEVIQRGKERLADQENNYADKIRGINQSLEDARLDAIDKREIRERDNKRTLEDFEKDSAEARQQILTDLAAATDDKDKSALEKKLVIFDREYTAKKEKLAEQAAEQEIRAKEDLELQERQAERRKQREAEENQRRLAEIRAQNEAERLGAEAKAAAELAKLQADNTARINELQTRITTENAQLAEQTAEINKEADKRMGRLHDDYTRATAEAKLRYDREVADNKAAHDKILADRQKRIEAEIADYNRVTRLIQTNLDAQLQKSQEVMPPVIKAIQDLGLKWEDIEKLKPDERMQLILSKLALMPDSANKAALEMQLFGKSGKDLNDIAEIYASKTLPQWMDQTKLANKLLGEDGVKAAVEFTRKQNEIKSEFEGLVGQIGRDLMPAFQTFLNKMQEFWQKHGPEITHFIDNLIQNGLPGLLGLIDKLFKALEYIGNTNVFKWISGQQSGIQTAENINSNLLSWFEQKAQELGLTNVFGGPTTPAIPSGPIAGGTPIGGTINNYTVNVQNPITSNADIPATVQYMQMTMGGSN